MPNSKKLLQAAAGNAAGGAAEFAEGAGFEGYSTNLVLNSNLNNTTSTKTFTFSFWVYVSSQGTSTYMDIIDAGANDFRFYVNGGQLYWYIANSSGSAYASQGSFGPFPYNQWNHIVISQDFSSTSNRHAYINDVAFISQSYGTYQNTNAGWNSVANGWAIGSQDTGSNRMQGRLAHVYFDETYRDLSVTNNRRLFVTEDLYPAEGQADLNPQLYMSFNEAWWDNYETNSNALNEGTAQDFSVNGTLYKPPRGPNQDNCASGQDTSTFYMTNSSAGLSSSTKFTLSCTFRRQDSSGNEYLCHVPGSPYGTLNIFCTGQQINIIAWNNSTTRILDIVIPDVPELMNHSLQISIDKTDTNKRHFILNGEEVTPTINTYNSTTIPFGNTFYISRSGSDDMEGSLGEFYFDTDYMDLSSNNPFWDSNNFQHVPMRTALENIASTPKMACPMLPPNTGLNLGTAGNFTPAAGQTNKGGRGASEFQAYGFEFTNADNYIDKVSGNQSLNGEATWAFAIYNTSTGIQTWLGSGSYYFRNVDNKLRFDTGTFAAETSNRMWSYPSWQVILFSYNYSSQLVKCVVNGANGISVVDNRWANLTGGSTDFPRNGANNGSAVAWLYMVDEYMDVQSLDVKKHFIDSSGYPKDLRIPIDNGDIPTPQTYLDFRDTSNIGSNYGSGSDWNSSGGTAGNVKRKSVEFPISSSDP